MGFFVFFMTLFILGGAGLGVYLNMVEMIGKSVRSDLLAISSAGSSLVSGGEHRNLRLSENMDSDEYRSMNERLRELLVKYPDLKYVYTAYMDGEDVKFGLDPTLPGDHDGDGVDDKSYLGEVYDNVSIPMKYALAEGMPQVETEPYTDKWGTFVSAFAPVYSDDGTLECVLGVDLDYRRYQDTFASAWWSFVGWTLVSILIAFGFAYSLMSILGRIQRSFERLMSAKKQVDAKNLELADLNVALDRQARFDELTGFYNRAAFELISKESTLELHRGVVSELSMAFIDVDNFKLINDTYGHDLGDEILKKVAERIRATVTGGAIARFGGDEFVVLYQGDDCTDRLRENMERLVRLFDDAIGLANTAHSCSVSVGIAKMTESEGTMVDLIRMADIAMYRAKTQGKNGLVLFEDRMALDVKDRVEIENDLREAWKNGELWVAVQPIVNLSTMKFSGGELLMRWTRQDGTPVSPVRFIPVAEETGLIVEMGTWILERCCFKLEMWSMSEKTKSATLTVNVSGRQLADPGFVQLVEGILDSYRFERSRLVLEVTESMMIDDVAAVNNRLQELRDLGLQIALDDFGTGYSSLSMLSKMPIDYLKIDQSFIMGMPGCSKTRSLTLSILQLAKGLGLKVVGEGVEAKEHCDELRSMGCDFGQGYAFSKPVPLDEYTPGDDVSEDLSQVA